jgi:hypothetical protein
MAVYGVEPKSRHTSRFVALPYQIMAENPAMLVEIGHCEEPKTATDFLHGWYSITRVEFEQNTTVLQSAF